MSAPSEIDNLPKKRGKHYCETAVFEIEGIVHRVPRHGLEKFSPLFHDMFTLPQPTNVNDSEDAPRLAREGDTDETPIKLVGCTNEEFESLIEVIYQLLGKTPELPKEKWLGVLRLSRLWDMPQIADVAIEKVTLQGMTPVEMVNLGREHGVPVWLKAGYTTLVGDTSRINPSELEGLGWETAFRVLWARDEVARSEYTATTSTSEGYWVKKAHISCGGCWRNWGTVFPISDSATSCSNCGNSYGFADQGVHIALPYTAMSSAPPPGRPCPTTKLVIEKVIEVFGEELKDAERGSCPETSYS